MSSRKKKKKRKGIVGGQLDELVVLPKCRDTGVPLKGAHGMWGTLEGRKLGIVNWKAIRSYCLERG